MTLSLSSHYWSLSESMIHTWFPLLVLVLLVIVFGFLLTLFYSTKSKKLVTIVSLSLLTIGISLIGIGHYYVATYNDYVPYQSVNNRNQRAKFLTSEDTSSAKHADLTYDSLIKTGHLPFYELTETLKEDVTYLGHNDYYYFFTIQDQLKKVDNKENRVIFSDEATQSQRLIATANLTDMSYEAIGFYSKVGPVTVSITVPKDEEHLSYDPERPVQTLHLSSDPL